MQFRLVMVAVMSAVVGAVVPQALAVPQTKLVWDVSSDGGSSWHSNLQVNPGSTLEFRLRVSLVGNTGPGRLNVGGIAGFNMLPNLSNWSSGDVALPLAAEAWAIGSNANPIPEIIPGPYPAPASVIHGSGVLNGGYGRQAPFGANGVNGPGIPTPRVVGSNLQLAAEIVAFASVSFSQFPAGMSAVYAWDGHSYLSNETGQIVADPPQSEIEEGLWQRYEAQAGNYFRSSVTNVVLFKYAVTLDSSVNSERVMTQGGSLTEPFVHYWPTQGVMPTSSTTGSNNIVEPAIVHVIPSPWSGVVLVAGVLGVVRRRRCSRES